MGWDPKRIADPAWFLDRHEERRRLRDAITAKDNLLIYGERRLGKSSLIRRVAGDHDATFLFVDCLFAATESELSSQILAAVRRSRLARARQAVDRAKQAARGLEIGIELRDDSIAPFLRTGGPAGRSEARPLEETLTFITRLAAASKRHVVLVVDEFQSVMVEAPDAIAKLRGHAQEQNDVTYLIAGSQQSILLGLTRHKSPFWRQLTEFHVGPIDLDESLRDVARITGVEVGDDARDRLADTVGHHTQRLVEVLDIAWNRHGAITVDTVDVAVHQMLARHDDGFERLLGACTPHQRRLLVALAGAQPDHPTGVDFVRDHDLRSASHVQKAMQRHQKEEILDAGGRFIDPAFRLWLLARSGATPSL